MDMKNSTAEHATLRVLDLWGIHTDKWRQFRTDIRSLR